MKSSKKMKLAAVAALGAGLIVSGCGDDFRAAVPGAETFSGKVVMEPVAGSTVCLDFSGDNSCADETVTVTTNAAGEYTLSFDGSVDAGANLLAMGGTFGAAGTEMTTPLLAPQNAANITVLTTVVAQAPVAQRAAIQARLDELVGGSFDADPSAETVTAELLQVVKSIETTMQAVTQVTGSAPAAAFFTQVADAILAQESTATIKTVLANSMSTAVAALVPESAAASVTALVQAQVNAVVDVIQTAADSGAVTEAAIQASVAAVPSSSTIQTLLDTALTQVPVANIRLASNGLVALDSLGNAVQSVDANGVVTVPAGAATLSATVAAQGGTSTVTYPSVKVELTIDDVNSSRFAKFTLNNALVTLPAGAGATASFSTSTASTLATFAQDATGTTVETAPVTGPFQVVQFSGNTVSFDVNGLYELVETQVAGEFGNISRPGTYLVTLAVTGAPFTTAVRTVVVTP